MQKKTETVDQMFAYAEHLFQLTQQSDWTPLKSSIAGLKSNHNKSIDDRLLELIIEEKSKPSKFKNLNSCSTVLQKLVAKEKLNHFVISLHSGNEGYTIGVQIHGIDEIIETMKLPYEENQLLEYIDSEELPPFLVDIIENSPLSAHKLFHDGCVICEVRDYRRSAPNFSHYFSSQWVLLRPTTQSITNDIINLIAQNSSEYIWTNEDKIALEAQIVLHTSPKLCLDPSPTVAILNSKLMRKKRMFRENHIIKLAKKCSQVTVNRVKKFESLSAPKGLKLHEFLKKRNKTSSQTKITKQIHTNTEEYPKDLVPLRNVCRDVESHARILPKLQISADNSLIKVEEYIMEFIDDNRRSLTNVSILHRPNDDTYFGQLYIDKQGQIRGSTCTFQLGTKQATQRYVDQFTEILTENGRKSVKITHQIPGHAPNVIYTPAAAASGMPTSAMKDPLEDEGMNLGATTPKKCKLSPVTEQSSVPQVTSPPLIQSPPINVASASTPVTKPMETLTIPPQVFSPPLQPAIDTKTSPLLTSGVHSTAGAAPITESALAVILTPSTGITKSIQTIDSTEGTHQPITTTTPLPTGVSLASLSLAPVQQNLRLHNLVSLTPQGLAVPISLTMMSTPTGQQSSIMTTPGSMIVSLEPSGTQQKDDENVTVTYATTPTTVLMSTGSMSGANNVLSVPIGMAGSLGVHSLSAQFITNQLKQTGGQIRTATPQVSLLQMNNSPTVPLLRPLAPAPHTLAPSSSSQTYSHVNVQSVNTPLQIQPLTPQQQLTNALRKQAQQQQIQLVPQKTPRKRQPKK